MKRRNQKDSRIICAIMGKEVDACLFQLMPKQPLGEYRSSFSKKSTTVYFANSYMEERRDYRNHVIGRNDVFDIASSFSFNQYTNLECFIKFRFCEKDIYRPIPARSWSAWMLGRIIRRKTDMNFSDLLCMCAIASLGGTNKKDRFEKSFSKVALDTFQIILRIY